MNEVKISFIGDISLNDAYNDLYERGEKPFDEVGEILKQSDLVVGNLECFAEGDKGENELKRPRLKTKLETLNYLNDIGVNIVSLANNHAYDNLEDGFEKTIGFLEKNGIRYLGASTKKGDESKPLLIEIKGHRICFLNYVTEDTNPNLPREAKVYLNWFNEDKIIEDIEKYKNDVDQVILLLHWGGRVEGGSFPDWDQPKIAKRLIDAGADLIIGHHSHTIQPYEVYKGKYIFYSLGNFCFADIRFEDKIINKRTRQEINSFIVNEAINGSYEVYIRKIKNTNSKIRVFNKMNSRSTKNISFHFILKLYFLWYLYWIKLKILHPILYFLIYDKNKKIYGKLKSIKLEKISKLLRRL